MTAEMEQCMETLKREVCIEWTQKLETRDRVLLKRVSRALTASEFSMQRQMDEARELQEARLIIQENQLDTVQQQLDITTQLLCPAPMTSPTAARQMTLVGSEGRRLPDSVSSMVPPSVG